MPIKLEAERRVMGHKIRKGISFEIGNFQYIPEAEEETTSGWDVEKQKQAFKEVRYELMRIWQEEW